MKRSRGVPGARLGLAMLISAGLFAPAATAQNEEENAFPPAVAEPARAAAGPEIASVPATLAFQGFLTDSLGTPLDTTVSLALAIYDVASGGAALWSETQPAVPVADGVFAAALGSVAAFPANLFATTPRYLGIRVNGGAELAPRTPLRSSPYALQAGNADLLGGDAATAFLRAAGDTATGVLELQGGLRSLQLGAATEVVNSTAGVLARRYFFDDDGVSWSGVKATLVLSFNGSGTPGAGGAGSAVVAYSGATVDSIAVPAGGGRPWTYRVPLTLGDNGTLDVTLRANSAGSPLYVRSITLETGESAAAPQWSESGSDLYRLSGNVGIGTATPGTKLHVEGAIRSGSASAGGQLDVYMSGAAAPVAVVGPQGSTGGKLHLFDEGGAAVLTFEPDVSSGGGGFLAAYRDSLLNAGLVVDGNYVGTREPRMNLMGSARSALLAMDQAGNNSVQLPADAIGSAECLNEPGVANSIVNSTHGLATGVLSTITSRTITPPADGWVLAMAGCELELVHQNGLYSSLCGGISLSSSSVPLTNYVCHEVSSGLPAHSAESPYHVSQVFPVTGGVATTFYFLLQDISGNYQAERPSLSLVYLPTAYGSTSAPALTGGGGMEAEDEPREARGSLTDAELAAERAASIAANDARMERELAELRARLEMMERELAAERARR